MTSQIADKIAEILKDKTRSQRERLAELHRLRDDARALQRAETESPMGGDSDLVAADLRQIDRALQRLGETEAAEAEERGPATL